MTKAVRKPGLSGGSPVGQGPRGGWHKSSDPPSTAHDDSVQRLPRATVPTQAASPCLLLCFLEERERERERRPSCFATNTREGLFA